MHFFCRVSVLLMIALMNPIYAKGQTSAPVVDLSKELSELSSAETLPDRHSAEKEFDWSEDISVLNDDLAKIALSNEEKKLGAIKLECKAAFAPEPVSLFTISKPRPVHPKNRANSDCYDKYVKPHLGGKLSEESIDRNAQCVARLTKLYTQQDEEKSNSDYARRQAVKDRKKETRDQTQKYCKSIESDLEAGRLPKENFPQWGEVDEVKTIEASISLQNDIDEVLSEADALNAKLFAEQRLKKERKEDAFAAKVAEKEAVRKENCRLKIRAGNCPCSCEDLCTRPPPTNDASQVCEK